MTSERDVIRLTQQISATLMTKKIKFSEFIDDINSVKSIQYKAINKRDFKKKYDLLFNGTYAKFKTVDIFLGSYRRNINPRYFSLVQNESIKQFNLELRFYTIDYSNIQSKVKVKFPNFISRKRYFKKGKYHENIGFKGFAENRVKTLAEVWNLNIVKKYNMFYYQCVQIKVNYDLLDDKNNIVYSNQWYTASSKYTNTMTLIECYNKAFENLLEYIANLEQSNLYVKLLRVCTYVIREAEK